MNSTHCKLWDILSLGPWDTAQWTLHLGTRAVSHIEHIEYQMFRYLSETKWGPIRALWTQLRVLWSEKEWWFFLPHHMMIMIFIFIFTPDDDVWFEAIPTDPSEVWLERNYHNIDNGKYISTQRSHVVCFLWKHIILFKNPLIYRGLVNTQSP